MSQSTYNKTAAKNIERGDMSETDYQFEQLPGFDLPDPFIATQEAILTELDRLPEQSSAIQKLSSVAVAMTGVRPESVVFDAVVALKARRLVSFQQQTGYVTLLAKNPVKPE